MVMAWRDNDNLGMKIMAAIESNMPRNAAYRAARTPSWRVAWRRRGQRGGEIIGGIGRRRQERKHRGKALAWRFMAAYLAELAVGVINAAVAGVAA
jgi:hypothetical protein